MLYLRRDRQMEGEEKSSPMESHTTILSPPSLPLSDFQQACTCTCTVSQASESKSPRLLTTGLAVWDPGALIMSWSWLNWCLHKKILRPGRTNVKTQEEVSHLQVKEKVHREKQSFKHLNLRLLASRIVRK